MLDEVRVAWDQPPDSRWPSCESIPHFHFVIVLALPKHKEKTQLPVPSTELEKPLEAT